MEKVNLEVFQLSVLELHRFGLVRYGVFGINVSSLLATHKIRSCIHFTQRTLVLFKFSSL